MLALPIALSSAIGVFAPVFSRPGWQHVQVLLPGAVLAPGKRTVPALLQMMGRSAASDFQTAHRVRTRAVWSPLTASRLRLRLWVAVCIPSGVVVFGLADPIERRRGAQSTATGLSRAPVRSSHASVVKVRGRRWLAGMLRGPLSWAERVWALPCLTVLCPSERGYAPRGRRHQPVPARAWQRIRLLGRWVPARAIGCVADRSCAVLARLAQVKPGPRARVRPRRRLDAALSDPPPHRAPGTPGRPRLTGQRRPPLEAVWAETRTPWTTGRLEPWDGEGPREVEGTTDTAVWDHPGQPPVVLRWVRIRDPHKRGKPQALVSPHLEQTPAQMLTWFVQRWPRAVTWEEARAPLGMETQRQGKERALARPTPARLSLYALVTLTAPHRIATGATCRRHTAWYRTPRPTFSDTLAWVRRPVWDHSPVSMSQQETDRIQRPRAWFERCMDAVCDAVSVDKVALRSCFKIHVSRFSNNRTILICIMASLLAVNVSSSRLCRRSLSTHAKVRSTFQRCFTTWKSWPVCSTTSRSILCVCVRLCTPSHSHCA
jgi:hypothetical protein